MAFLVVVKRDEPALFSYLQDHFQEPEVTVVMDRRHGERRRRREPDPPDDRRHRDRRASVVNEDPLWRYGFRVAVARAG